MSKSRLHHAEGDEKIYYNRIKAGIMTIKDVPARWRAAVQAMLDEDEQGE